MKKNIKCFACDKAVKKGPRYARTWDGQQVIVGPDCAKQVFIHAGGEHGYQPPKGGPRLYFTILFPCPCHETGEFINKI